MPQRERRTSAARAPGPPRPASDVSCCSSSRCLLVASSIGLVRAARCAASVGLADHVHVLGLPAERAPGRRRRAAAARSASSAFGTSTVIHTSPASSTTIWVDGAEVDRALDDALDARAGRRRAGLARQRRSAASPGRTTAWQRSPAARPSVVGVDLEAGVEADRAAAAGRRDVAGHQVGDADEAGDEGGASGARRRPPASPICSTRPRFMTAIRSDIVSASSWSWVT